MVNNGIYKIKYNTALITAIMHFSALGLLTIIRGPIYSRTFKFAKIGGKPRNREFKGPANNKDFTVFKRS